MSQAIPLFPLKIVVFPNEALNLHIFEPRYKKLIEECNTTGMHFGIPCYFEKEPLLFGTEMKLLEIVHTYPDGKMDIKTQGLRVFKIKKFERSFSNKLYSGGQVEFLENKLDGDPTRNSQILEKLKELFGIMNINKEIPELDHNFNSFKIAHLVGFSLRQEYELLSISAELDRLDFIYEHLDNLIPIVIEMENLRKKAEMNGHFKNLIPPDLI